MTLLAGIVVIACGLWLTGLAVSMVVVPERAARLLKAFASSARAHYTEQLLRLVAGLAMVVFAPEMKFAELFGVFGWVLALTAIGLLLMPWRWHRRFAEWAIPLAIRHIKLYGLGAFVLGAFVFYSLL